MSSAPSPAPRRPGRQSAARPAATSPAPPRPAAAPRTPISARGAVDLSTYRSPAGTVGSPPATPPGSVPAAGTAPPGSFTRAVDEAGFQADVLEQSMTVPVVLDLWATWCEPCKQLSPILERLADEYAGRFLLATVDVDAEQRIAAALQVQSIPSVLGVIRGQLVPLFTGAVPEQQVRQVLEEMLRVAVENGLTGIVASRPPDGTDAAATGAAAEPPEDPRLTAAYDAVEAGDYEQAADRLRGVLASEPGLPEAVAGLAQVNLLIRVASLDHDAAIESAALAPDDVAAGLRAADAEFTAGEIADAFQRLVALVRLSSGGERNEVRARLLELFDVLGPDDPRVGPARVGLANALF